MDHQDLKDLSLLRILPDAEGAASLREALESSGIGCEVQDRRLTDPATLGSAAPGVWLLVPKARRADAEARLAKLEADGGLDAEGDALCAGCDCSDFSAVPPRESPEGSWYLRCLNCGRLSPVAEPVYRSDHYLILPPACPNCGSFRIEPGETPEYDMGRTEGQDWWRCESCEHEWAAVAEEKGPGTGRSGEALEPWLREALEQAPPELLDPPPEVPPHEEECGEDDGPRYQCPRCLGKPESMNDALVAKGGPLRFLCGRCGQVWDVSLPPEAPLPDLPVVRGGDATTDPHIACPQCGSAETETSEPPDYAAESGLARFFKSLFGGTLWRNCRHCGHQWEAQA